MRHAIWLALLLSTQAGAQEAPPVQPPDIVVSGVRDREEQVRGFVRALTAEPRGGTLSRFAESVCPTVIGLSPAQDKAVAARMRAVAAAAGIPVADEDCAPNAILIVTENKRALIEALARERPDYFGDLPEPRIRRLARSPGPAAAWQLEAQVDARGVPLAIDPGYGAPVNRTTEPLSRIMPVSRWAFDAAALVVESGAAMNLTTTQLADYAAMRLLAKLDPSRLTGSATPSILSSLDAPPDTQVPITLTHWDLAFLRGLYASRPNQFAASQRSAIARQMEKELAGADDEKKRD